MATVSGNVFVGGFFGNIIRNTGTNISVSTSTSGGNLTRGDIAGGFVGCANNNQNVIIDFNHCKHNGFMDGNASVAGFIGRILSSSSSIDI